MNKESEKKKLKIIYIVGGILFCFFLGIIFIGRNVTENGVLPMNSKKESTSVYGEDDSESLNKTDVGVKKEMEEIHEIANQSKRGEVNKNPNLLKVSGKYYYLFDETILLPLDTMEWSQVDIVSTDGKYDKISEFYVTGESSSNWTQKFTIHKIKSEDKNCFDFTDKLVNGIIVSVSDQLASSGIELQENNLAFNYLEKQADNTLMYWEIKNIPNNENATQFVRTFISPYSKNMYLVTYTIKVKMSDLNDETIKSNFTILNGIQELKRKD